MLVRVRACVRACFQYAPRGNRNLPKRMFGSVCWRMCVSRYSHHFLFVWFHRIIYNHHTLDGIFH